MGRPRLGPTLKKPSDYSYDYPEQREIGRHLLSGDKKRIAEITGYSYQLITDWCLGRRRNSEIEKYARIYADLNKKCLDLKQVIV